MSEPSPQEKVAGMVTASWIAQAIYVAAKLGVADLLEDGPRTAEKLAEASESHGPSLYRLLRALASLGIFSEGEGRQFSLTPMAECLRTLGPGSQRALA
ncbi:methyltransferase family protein, partial [Singulisphaera rosea]